MFPFSACFSTSFTLKATIFLFTLPILQAPVLSHYGGASDSELLEEMSIDKLTPRVSTSAAEDDPPSGSSTPKRKFSKFNIGQSAPQW